MDEKAIAKRLQMSRLDKHYDKAFQIMEFDQVDSTHWHVRGRVLCHEIRVGDILSAWGSYAKLNQRPASFKLVRIETYGHDLPDLGMTWTGQVMLEGKGGEILGETHLLLRRLTSRHE